MLLLNYRVVQPLPDPVPIAPDSSFGHFYSQNLLPPPQHLAATKSPLCLYGSLFWIFRIHGFIQHVAFCVWFLSLCITFLRFIHIISHISIILFRFIAE